MKKPAQSQPVQPLKAATIKEFSFPSRGGKSPSEDAIHPSKDVIGDMREIRGDKVYLPPESDNRDSEDGDLTKMVVATENKNPNAWHENPYLPTQPKLLGSKEQEDRFLEVLREKKYIVWAAPAFGCSDRTVERRMLENPEFATAVHDVITHRERMMLATIEAVSETEAVKEGRNTDRAMQLNALGYGKYKRDAKGVQVATQVNIMIGFSPPKHRGT